MMITLSLFPSCLIHLQNEDDEEYIEVKVPEKPNPINRTYNILSHDVKSIIDTSMPPLQEFASHVDVLVIGGGVMGSAIAYWLKQRTGRNCFSVSVVEKDPSVCCTNYSVPLFLSLLEVNIYCFYYYSTQDLQQYYRWVDYGSSFHLKKIFKCLYTEQSFSESPKNS